MWNKIKQILASFFETLADNAGDIFEALGDIDIDFD